jgi:hypothetical protein
VLDPPSFKLYITWEWPGIVLFHAGANASHNYAELRVALSEAFTLYITDAGLGRGAAPDGGKA